MEKESSIGRLEDHVKGSSGQPPVMGNTRRNGGAHFSSGMICREKLTQRRKLCFGVASVLETDRKQVNRVRE